jgi:hypothetical protein
MCTYVIEKVVWIPISLTLQDVEMDVATNNLINIILQYLTKFKGLVE